MNISLSLHIAIRSHFDIRQCTLKAGGYQLSLPEGTITELENPSLEVARTTLQLVLLIYSYNSGLLFLYVTACSFSTFTFSLSAEKETFPSYCNLEL